jgi:hypothetical protein
MRQQVFLIIKGLAVFISSDSSRQHDFLFDQLTEARGIPLVHYPEKIDARPDISEFGLDRNLLRRPRQPLVFGNHDPDHDADETECDQGINDR